jgi:hypothetical protein
MRDRGNAHPESFLRDEYYVDIVGVFGSSPNVSIGFLKAATPTLSGVQESKPEQLSRFRR